MDRELEKNLVETYPKLYRHYGGDIRKTCMGWGFSCGDGWYNLISDLSQNIKDLDKHDRVVADQVKEKFGGLRFYYHIEGYGRGSRFYQLKNWLHWKVKVKIPYYFRIRNWLVPLRKKYLYKRFDEKIDELVSNAEQQSYKECERCGSPGQRRSGGWVRTLCDLCEKEYLDPDRKGKLLNSK